MTDYATTDNNKNNIITSYNPSNWTIQLRPKPKRWESRRHSADSLIPTRKRFANNTTTSRKRPERHWTSTSRNEIPDDAAISSSSSSFSPSSSSSFSSSFSSSYSSSSSSSSFSSSSSHLFNR
ncbi:uncharacterized protein LOC135225558 [Macrobrachium nipponense]|uniref:uncharacterized protein LOC135225558 n=1 Tax=Macrobrachium nipponense TaxID=159736 RepID=UPI0030C7A5D5